MAHINLQCSPFELWSLVERQHGVVARTQLLAAGLSADAIKHRIGEGRLHPVWRGVYAVGRPGLSRRGIWMAAVLSCGPEAVLSHESAAALWQIRTEDRGHINVSVPAGVARRRPGIRVHRRVCFGTRDVTGLHGIPVTTPTCTLADLASRLSRDQLEAAINEADKRDLIDPDTLRAALAALGRRPGVRVLCQVLDRRTFTLTDSQLERRFVAIARRVGLPTPQTGARVNGFKVDFHWPSLGLVVETDGLRYHRTPAQQARDRLRDQVHTARGLTPLRFTHFQVAFEADHVEMVLAAVAAQCAQGDSNSHGP
jgi:very-short-patch-repair endonuclease